MKAKDCQPNDGLASKSQRQVHENPDQNRGDVYGQHYSLPTIVGSLEQNYCYRPIVNEIPHDIL
jgi:hypothetical protein